MTGEMEGGTHESADAKMYHIATICVVNLVLERIKMALLYNIHTPMNFVKYFRKLHFLFFVFENIFLEFTLDIGNRISYYRQNKRENVFPKIL